MVTGPTVGDVVPRPGLDAPAQDDEKPRPAAGGGAEDFREAQVVANEGRHGEATPLEHDDVAARLVRLCFAAEAKGMNLRIARHQFPLG